MSASADESLRLWHCWKMDKSVKAAKTSMNKLSMRNDSGITPSIR
jgi:hypothetical protein